MILTPLPPDAVAPRLRDLQQALAGHGPAQAVVAAIAATWPVDPAMIDTPAQRAEGVALAHAFGIGTCDEEPMTAFMWDGQAIRTRIEAAVIIHEVAHWLCAAPERRPVLDFGLGAGPETGRRAEAEAAMAMPWSDCQEEECLASLLGIRWEAALGHPAILAFLEQNWLEAIHRPQAIAYFVHLVETLQAMGLLDAAGVPLSPARYRLQAGVPGAFPDWRTLREPVAPA